MEVLLHRGLAAGVILSHREGHARGIASNHGDPTHLWTQLNMGYTMDGFRRAVKAAMDGESSSSNDTYGYTKIMGVTANGMKGNSFNTPHLGIRAQVQHLKAYASADVLVNACIDPRFPFVTRGCAEYVEWLGQKENPAGKGWATGEKYGEKILAVLNGITKEAAEPEASGKFPYQVRVKIDDLNIRTGPGINHSVTGQVTGRGSFTIVEERQGLISSSGKMGWWGLLKSYQKNKDGWICLSFAERA